MIHAFQPTFDWHEIWAVLQGRGGRNEFESAVAKRVGARYSVAFAYGRSAVVAILKAWNLDQAEIILPAYTCEVVAEAVVVSNNRPVFVDIGSTDYNMDLEAIRSVLTPRTRAIIATDLYGYPAHIRAVREIAGDGRILIIDDAANLGPVPLPREAERRADATLFSFSAGKHMYAVSGGVVVTDRFDLYEKIKAYREREMFGLPRKVLAKRLARLATGYMMLNAPLFAVWKGFNESSIMLRARSTLDLVHVSMPSDYATAFADLQGRVGMAQLRKFDSIRARSRDLAEYYDRELSDVPGIILPPARSGVICRPYTVLVERRDELGFRERMLDQGIEVGTSFDYVLPIKEQYRRYANGDYPRAQRVAREVVNLPNYASLSGAGARRVVDSTRRALAVTRQGEERDRTPEPI